MLVGPEPGPELELCADADAGAGSYPSPVLPLLSVLVAAVLMILAFPPYGVLFLAVPALAVLAFGVVRLETGRVAAFAGGLFGFVFVGGLMIWIRNLTVGLADAAWLMLGAFHVPAFAWFGWLAHRVGKERPGIRIPVTVAGWASVFAILRWLPVFSLEWADPGYSMAPLAAATDVSAVIGASGWTVVLALASMGLVLTAESRNPRAAMNGLGLLAVVLVLGATVDLGPDGPDYRLAIVQGNSPCARVGCVDERRLITEGHLDLTRTLPAGEYDLVVWAESSTGFTTDALTNPEWAEAIGAEARRIDTFLLQGTDRPVGSDGFVNANLLFDRSGTPVAEYRKQHPVPFGERVPWRSVFGGLDGMRASDMVSGEGPVVFDLDGVKVGSVISFEGAFGRYAREHAALGAQLLVVATNESSYGEGAAADQLIWMTRMRSAELGLPVVHAAITGASTIIQDGVPGEVSGLYEQAIIEGTVRLRDTEPTPYARYGDWFTALAMLIGGSLWVMTEVRRLSPGAHL